MYVALQEPAHSQPLQRSALNVRLAGLLESRGRRGGTAGSVNLPVQAMEIVRPRRFDVVRVDHLDGVVDGYPSGLEAGTRARGSAETNERHESLIVGLAAFVRPRAVAVRPLSRGKASTTDAFVERPPGGEGDEGIDRRRHGYASRTVADGDLHIPDAFHGTRLGIALLGTCGTRHRRESACAPRGNLR